MGICSQNGVAFGETLIGQKVIRPPTRLLNNAEARSHVPYVDMSFAKFGSSAERKRLLGRWDKEIGAK